MAAAGFIVSIVDIRGVDVTANPTVGLNGTLFINTAWTDANGDAVSIGSVIGIGVPGAVASLGRFITASTSNALGQVSHLYDGGATRGIATLTLTLGVETIRFTVEVGGGVVDALSAAAAVDIDAAVGDQVVLAVIAMANRHPSEDTLIRYESAQTVVPSQARTDANGRASAVVTSDDARVVTVIVTAVSDPGRIPIGGVNSISHVLPSLQEEAAERLDEALAAT